MSRSIPLASHDEMILQSFNRITQRPALRFIGGAIFRWVIARRVTLRAIREVFYERSSQAAPRSFGGPGSYRPDGQEIIAVNAQAGDSITHRFRCKGCFIGACDSAVRGDRPLIVGHPQNDRRAVDARERECLMEVAFCGSAFANEADGDATGA